MADKPDSTPAAEPIVEYPARVTMLQDTTFWIPLPGGAEFTAQFVAGQVVTEPGLIRQIVDRGIATL